MNTRSYYKDITSKGIIEGSKQKVEMQGNIVPTHIKINSPAPGLSETCYKFEYNINNVINSDFSKLPTSPKLVVFCIYRIVNCKNREGAPIPFVQYLLYKYPDKIVNQIVFPFVKYTKTNILKMAGKYIKSISDQELKCKGFIENNNNVYLFFNISEAPDFTIQTISLKNRNSVFWWALLDEICNHKSILNIPIHKSVYNIFFKNPSLLYIKYDHKRLEIPMVAYYGNYYKYIPIVAAVGQQAVSPIKKQRGKLFYYGSFRKAIRFGSWTPDYTERILNNENIADIDGRYKEGGIIRYALFLGKTKTPLNEPYDKLEKIITNTDWTDKYQSLVIGSVDFDHKKLSINPEYITVQQSQSVSLSYHKINGNSVKPTWDPLYDKYTIQ